MTGVKITVEFDESVVEDIDKLKKDISREEWIRRGSHTNKQILYRLFRVRRGEMTTTPKNKNPTNVIAKLARSWGKDIEELSGLSKQELRQINSSKELVSKSRPTLLECVCRMSIAEQTTYLKLIDENISLLELLGHVLKLNIRAKNLKKEIDYQRNSGNQKVSDLLAEELENLQKQ